jgi:chorismate synthase
MLTRLRFLTSGESHGPALMGILEGMPAGLVLDRERIQRDMSRRRAGHGRSARMQIEGDLVDIKGGVRLGKTLGGPIGFVIENQDHPRWRDVMSVWPTTSSTAPAPVTVPRPGHADRAGLQKLGAVDVRDVLERASARETAARVAVGALCRQLLEAVGIHVGSHVVEIGAVALDIEVADRGDRLAERADASAVRCIDEDAGNAMIAAIDAAKSAGDTLGGAFEVVATGLPVGLGHFVHWDRRLSARLAEALGSIHAVRAVSFGQSERITGGGRAFHDAITVDGRASNRAGGVEGGMSNGMPLVVRAQMKPLSTVAGGLPTIDVVTGEAALGHVERSDTCAVPAASIVGEAMVCIVLADALLEKFGGDSLDQLKAHMAASAVRP